MDTRINFSVYTLFPEILDAYFSSSIMSRAITKGIISYQSIQIRDYATDKHHKCDDAPYGGGAGMLMLPEPLDLALKAKLVEGTHVVYMSASGKRLDQAMAKSLSEKPNIAIICGRYEGIDQRVIDRYVDEEVSIGDYVLSSGEVAALCLIDAVYRLVDGVITGESLVEESFQDGLLEYPQYTRPENYDSLRVPEVLISGHHAQIAQWRLREKIAKTLRNRPDLIERAKRDGLLSEKAKFILAELESERGM